MSPSADSQPAMADPATTPAARAASGAWSKLTENPLLTILGTATVGLLLLMLARTESRIDRLEDRMEAGFAAVDARFEKVDAEFDALGRKLTARIDELDAKIDALDRKLTALIAALNATEEIEATLDGRLLEPAAAGPGSAAGDVGDAGDVEAPGEVGPDG